MDRVIDAACLSGYTDLGKVTGTGERLLQRSWVFLAELLTFVMRARDERRMWIACRWPNPSVQITTRDPPRTVACLSGAAGCW